MKKILAVSALITGSALATLDMSAANIALPVIASSLEITPEQSVWITSVYQLAMLATLLPLSALGDRLGHKHIYFIGLLLFTLASLLSGLAQSLITLTIARFIQGIAAAGILGVSSALLRMIFSANQMGRAQGLNAFSVAVFFAIGPTIASIVLLVADWHWLFLMNVPLGMVAMLVAYYCLPDNNDIAPSDSFNYINALLISMMFIFGIYGITEFSHGVAIVEVFNYIGLSLLCFVILRWRERFILAPLFPIDLLKIPYFSFSIIISIFSYTAQGLAFIAIPFLLHQQLGRTVVEIGILFTPWPLMNAIVAPLSGYFSDKISVSLLCCVGLIILSIGLGCMAQLQVNATVWDISWRLMLCGIGFGIFQSPNLKALSLAAPQSRMGAASGMIPTARLVGLSLGSAFVSACLAFNPEYGITIALWFGVLFAILGASVSALRLNFKHAF